MFRLRIGWAHMIREPVAAVYLALQASNVATSPFSKRYYALQLPRRCTVVIRRD